jgi:DNA-binding transcriptional LysR family regulator
MPVSWRHVEFFHAVMSTGSMTQAATLLRTSQPTVSRELSELERLLGFDLFERKGRRLVATAQAMLLHAEVKRSYVGLQQVVHAGQAIRDNMSDRVQVACLPLFAQTLMPAVCRRFVANEPAARFSFHVMDQSILIRELLDLKYDFGVVEAGVAVEGTVVREIPIGDEVVILPTGHRLCRKRLIEPGDLDGECFISYAADDIYRRRFDRIFDQARIGRRLQIETTTAEAVCALVQQGIGVSIVNPISAHAYRGKGVEIRRLSISIPFVIGLCRPTGQAAGKLGERLMSYMLAECTALQRLTGRAWSTASGRGGSRG